MQEVKRAEQDKHKLLGPGWRYLMAHVKEEI